MHVKLLSILIIAICHWFVPSLSIFRGSIVTDQSDYKFQVSIRLKHFESTYGNGYICSGTLITRNSVLTSAKCVYHYQDNKIRDPKEFIVVLGSLWRTKFYPTLLERDVTKITIHKSFNHTRNSEYDLAILRLHTALSEKVLDIAPIEIRSSNNTNNLVGYVSSWGDTNINMPTDFSDVLTRINVEIQTADKCKTLVGSLGAGQLCVTTREIGSTCYGDLGAPFVANGMLVGFVTEEKACKEAMGQPMVITSTAYFKKWIDTNDGVALKSISFIFLTAISFIVVMT